VSTGAVDQYSTMPGPAAAPAACGDLEYGGEGEPDVVVVSELPLQGPQRVRTLPMEEAIRSVFETAGWRAGDVTVGYRSCDHSTAEAGAWDPALCAQNATSHAADHTVVAAIGPFDPGCASIMIPVTNQGGGGGLPLVSPSNRLPCLTEPGPGCQGHEPDGYYPTGIRTFLRVVAHDAYQATALAQFMQDQATTKLYALNDGSGYGVAMATYVRKAAQHLGIEVVGFETWDPAAASYEELMAGVASSGADGVFLGGTLEENGAQVIRDKVALVGPNDGVKLYLPDGFARSQTSEEAGAENVQGAFVSAPGVPAETYTGEAAELVAGWQAALGTEFDPSVLDAMQAARLVLDAIARAGEPTRAAVLEQLFASRVTGSLIGDFAFNEYGDPEPASGPVVGFTIADGASLETVAVVYAEPEIVDSVRNDVIAELGAR
jgi:branched-chain amino acid transport system substrate-binding protein